MNEEKLNDFLYRISLKNKDERITLRYEWKEIELIQSIEESVKIYFQPAEAQIRNGDREMLRESLSLWFSNPLSSIIGESEYLIADINAFFSLLDAFFQHQDFFIFNIHLPFDVEGAFSEHYAITDSIKLYVLEFVIS